MRSNIVALWILASALVAAEPAHAQTQQQINWCNGKDNANADLTIGGCTAIIQSGKFKADSTAIAFYLRGKAYAKKKETDKAMADYSQAIKLNPKYTLAYIERGGTYMWSKKGYGAALRDLDAAIKLDPNNATAWAYRGDTLYKLGKEELAIASFAQSMQLNPNWMWPANDRGELYADRGDYELAIRDFDHVIRVSGDYAIMPIPLVQAATI